jgi:hypothetical protein
MKVSEVTIGHEEISVFNQKRLIDLSDLPFEGLADEFTQRAP